MADDTQVAACVKPLYRGPDKGKPATCTEAGYLRHRRAGEQACEACKAALRVASRVRYDPERHSIHTRHWYENNREKHIAATKQWQRDNRESERERIRLRQQRDPQAWSDYQRRWRQANPERTATIKHRNRVLRESAPHIPFTADQLAQRLSMFAGCWICGGPDADTIDHVKPLAVGGWHCLSNLRPACSLCNCRKRDKWPFRPDMA
jgi:5-methylcytosine-specific restriction endonuclease McrA